MNHAEERMQTSIKDATRESIEAVNLKGNEHKEELTQQIDSAKHMFTNLVRDTAKQCKNQLEHKIAPFTENVKRLSTKIETSVQQAEQSKKILKIIQFLPISFNDTGLERKWTWWCARR